MPGCEAVLGRPGDRLRRGRRGADYQAAMETMRKTGQQGVPVIGIDGESVIGFDRARTC